MGGAVFAFIRRDFRIWASYRIAALWQMLGLVATLIVVFAVGRVVIQSSASFMARYHTDYTGYLLTTLTFVEIWTVGFLLSKALRENQATGTLEAMMLSHFGIFRLMLCSAAFPTLMSLIRVALFGAIAVTVFGLWHAANLLAVLAVFSAGLLAMGCLGILSFAFVLVLKVGDPILAAYGVLNALFAGAFFPRDVLPQWLQVFSFLLPLTYALDGMREALQGATVVQIAPQLLVLTGMFAGLLPVTIAALNFAVKRAKEEGSFVQY